MNNKEDGMGTSWVFQIGPSFLLLTLSLALSSLGLPYMSAQLCVSHIRVVLGLDKHWMK